MSVGSRRCAYYPSVDVSQLNVATCDPLLSQASVLLPVPTGPLQDQEGWEITVLQRVGTEASCLRASTDALVEKFKHCRHTSSLENSSAMLTASRLSEGTNTESQNNGCFRDLLHKLPRWVNALRITFEAERARAHTNRAQSLTSDYFDVYCGFMRGVVDPLQRLLGSVNVHLQGDTSIQTYADVPGLFPPSLRDYVRARPDTHAQQTFLTYALLTDYLGEVHAATHRCLRGL